MLVERDHELILEEAALSVHSVPVEDCVEWVEEWLIVSQAINISLELLVVVHLIERSYEVRIEHPGRSLTRKRDREVADTLVFRLTRKIARHEEPTTELVAFRGAIHPRHAVLIQWVAFSRHRDEIVDVSELYCSSVEVRRLNGQKFYLGPRDQSGQSQSSDSRGVQTRVLSGRTGEMRAVGSNESESRNVPAEGSRSVMILTMDIVRYSTTDGHKFCAW